MRKTIVNNDGDDAQAVDDGLLVTVGGEAQPAATYGMRVRKEWDDIDRWAERQGRRGTGGDAVPLDVRSSRRRRQLERGDVGSRQQAGRIKPKPPSLFG